MKATSSSKCPHHLNSYLPAPNRVVITFWNEIIFFFKYSIFKEHLVNSYYECFAAYLEVDCVLLVFNGALPFTIGFRVGFFVLTAELSSSDSEIQLDVMWKRSRYVHSYNYNQIKIHIRKICQKFILQLCNAFTHNRPWISLLM